MKISYSLYLFVDRKNEVLLKKVEAFTNLYYENKHEFGYDFTLTTKDDFNEAIEILDKDNIKYQSQYNIIPDEIEEFTTYLIGFPTSNKLYSPDNKINERLIEKHKVMHDLSDYTIIASQKFKNIIDEFANDIHWKRVENCEACFRVESITKLKNPLGIVKTREIRENTLFPGTYTILSDGRFYIDKENQNLLGMCHWASFSSYEVKGRIYPIRYRHLVSAGLMAKLIENKIHGITDAIIPVFETSKMNKLLSIS